MNARDLMVNGLGINVLAISKVYEATHIAFIAGPDVKAEFAEVE